MHRRRYLTTLGAAATVATTGCFGSLTPPGPDGLVNPSFENGLAGWRIDADLPDDPNTDSPVRARANRTTDPVSDGEWALSLFLDGSQDDGTIWVQQPVDLSTAMTLSVDVFSEQESFNTVTNLAVYAGPDPGRDLREQDFDTTRPTEDHEGWKTQSYAVGQAEEGLVAVGISVVWETEVTRVLDNLRLS